MSNQVLNDRMVQAFVEIHKAYFPISYGMPYFDQLQQTIQWLDELVQDIKQFSDPKSKSLLLHQINTTVNKFASIFAPHVDRLETFKLKVSQQQKSQSREYDSIWLYFNQLSAFDQNNLIDASIALSTQFQIMKEYCAQLNFKCVKNAFEFCFYFQKIMVSKAPSLVDFTKEFLEKHCVLTGFSTQKSPSPQRKQKPVEKEVEIKIMPTQQQIIENIVDDVEIDNVDDFELQKPIIKEIAVKKKEKFLPPLLHEIAKVYTSQQRAQSLEKYKLAHQFNAKQYRAFTTQLFQHKNYFDEANQFYEQKFQHMAMIDYFNQVLEHFMESQFFIKMFQGEQFTFETQLSFNEHLFITTCAKRSIGPLIKHFNLQEPEDYEVGYLAVCSYLLNYLQVSQYYTGIMNLEAAMEFMQEKHSEIFDDEEEEQEEEFEIIEHIQQKDDSLDLEVVKTLLRQKLEEKHIYEGQFEINPTLFLKQILEKNKQQKLRIEHLGDQAAILLGSKVNQFNVQLVRQNVFKHLLEMKTNGSEKVQELLGKLDFLQAGVAMEQVVANLSELINEKKELMKQCVQNCSQMNLQLASPLWEIKKFMDLFQIQFVNSKELPQFSEPQLLLQKIEKISRELKTCVYMFSDHETVQIICKAQKQVKAQIVKYLELNQLMMCNQAQKAQWFFINYEPIKMYFISESMKTKETTLLKWITDESVLITNCPPMIKNVIYDLLESLIYLQMKDFTLVDGNLQIATPDVKEIKEVLKMKEFEYFDEGLDATELIISDFGVLNGEVVVKKCTYERLIDTTPRNDGIIKIEGDGFQI